MADEFLQGASLGARIVGEGFDEYWKQKAAQQAFSERALAAKREEPLSSDALEEFRKSGYTPDVTRTQQMNWLGQQYKSDKDTVPNSDTVKKVYRDAGEPVPTAERVPTSEFKLVGTLAATKKRQENIVDVNDVDRQNYKLAYGKEMPGDMTSWHAAQQKEVADMAKAKSKPVGAGGGGLSDKQVESNVDSIEQGGMTLSMLGGMGSQRARINAAYEERWKKDPSLLPMVALENNLTAQRKRIATLNGAQITNEVVSVGQFNNAIDGALEKLDSVDAGAFTPWNKLKQYGAEKFASNTKYGRDLAVLKALNSEVALQSSRVFSGTASSDIQFKNELERLNAAQSKESYKDVAKKLRTIANTRKSMLLGAPAYLPGGGELKPGDTLQVKPTTGTTTAPDIPAVKEKAPHEMSDDEIMQSLNK